MPFKIPEMAGEKYRPSNGTEGMIFMEEFCDRCRNDSEKHPCEILALTMAFDTDHEDYPKEWVYNAQGWPVCTKFNDGANGCDCTTTPDDWRCLTLSMDGNFLMGICPQCDGRRRKRVEKRDKDAPHDSLRRTRQHAGA